MRNCTSHAFAPEVLGSEAAPPASLAFALSRLITVAHNAHPSEDAPCFAAVTCGDCGATWLARIEYAQLVDGAAEIALALARRANESSASPAKRTTRGASQGPERARRLVEATFFDRMRASMPILVEALESAAERERTGGVK